MDIEDAFSEEAIANHDTNVADDLQERLHRVISQIYITNEINWGEETITVAMLCFVAGRTYQAEMDQFSQDTSAATRLQIVTEFMEFLNPRGDQ